MGTGTLVAAGFGPTLLGRLTKVYDRAVDPADDARLKQFEVLWSEIARRSNAQQALVALNVTAAGTVGGLVITGRADSVLLVVLAVISPVVGLLWIDHARNIGEIGEFIGREWPWTPNWERNSASQKEESRGRFYVFILATTIVFLGPAFAGLIASVGRVTGIGQVSGWGLAIVLTSLYCVSWATQVFRSRPRKHEVGISHDAGGLRAASDEPP
jgi:hypothetical protein